MPADSKMGPSVNDRINKEIKAWSNKQATIT